MAPRFAHKWWTDKDFAAAKNDLEKVVFEQWPALEEFRDALLGSGARRAMLSGSGSTVYGAFPDADEARQQAGRLAERFPDWRIVETRTTPRGIRIRSGS